MSTDDETLRRVAGMVEEQGHPCATAVRVAAEVISAIRVDEARKQRDEVLALLEAERTRAMAGYHGAQGDRQRLMREHRIYGLDDAIQVVTRAALRSAPVPTNDKDGRDG